MDEVTKKAAEIIQSHLIVGPRPGQCLCGYGDESLPVKLLGRPHSEHVAKQLYLAGVLKDKK